MTDDQDSPKVVVVTGDVTMDWNLARPRSFPNTGQTWNTEDAIRGYWLRGGAALLAGVIRKVAAQLDNKYEVHPLIEPPDRVSPDDPQHHHSYALWSLFKYEEKPGDDDTQIYVWRVKEFLGLQRPEPAGALAVDEWERLAAEVKRASLVVLDDAGLGFRDHSEIWSDAFKANEHSPWIILKMARPVAQGKLWEHLSQRCPSRLIVVIPVNDLRLTEAQISRELSWERTAQDLAWELVYNPALSSLSKCAHVVVSLDAAGVVLLSTDHASAKPQARLFFRPEVIEGMWAQKYPGGMIGYTSCLVAGLARELMLNLDRPDLPQAIQNGIAAMEVLHKEGYGKRERDHDNQPVPFQFPSDLIVAELAKKASPLSTNTVPDPGRSQVESRADCKGIMPNRWTILQDLCDQGAADHRYELADRIVRKGAKSSLRNVPLGQFGKLLTVDRQEIESFRSIRALISEYDRQERQERPLSIAVFGAPGSGKSFGVTEVAKSVLPNRVEKLTFNLSQFNDPKELLGALHKVRDVALSDKVPLVFWDEFDTTLDKQPLGWLRYFLSPMQDGSFQEGQITHPIGRSIFVFAGGTSERREDFGKQLNSEQRATAKVRDFVSRLKGYLDILGPNPGQGDRQNDPDYIIRIRRAILLRAFLEDKALQLFRPRDRKGEVDIDQGVLRAFLRIQKYQHGARSMESIVSMSVLAGKNRFERSSLPSEEQLDLHVNGQAFLALVQQIEFDKEGRLLEQLAEVNHQVYCAELQAKGNAAPYSGQPYAQLPDDIKEQNRDAVRDIKTKLDLAGYVMIPARVSERPFSFPSMDVELLAEHEHGRWMELKVKNDWRYARERNDEAKLHPDLLPWRSKLIDEERGVRYSSKVREAIGEDELSEAAKEKDRISVRGIPRVLAHAGFTIVKVRDETEAVCWNLSNCNDVWL